MSVLAFVAAFVLNHGTTVTMVIISNGNRKRQWQTITVTKPKAEINFICGRCVYVSIVCVCVCVIEGVRKGAEGVKDLRAISRTCRHWTLCFPHKFMCMRTVRKVAVKTEH